jgi:competence protein ComEC
MGGWTLSSRRATYVFRRFALQPGARVTIHSGEGTDTSRQLYLNRLRFIWSDRHDVARLRDAEDLIVDRCSYHRETGDGSAFAC